MTPTSTTTPTSTAVRAPPTSTLCFDVTVSKILLFSNISLTICNEDMWHYKSTCTLLCPSLRAWLAWDMDLKSLIWSKSNSYQEKEKCKLHLWVCTCPLLWPPLDGTVVCPPLGWHGTRNSQFRSRNSHYVCSYGGIPCILSYLYLLISHKETVEVSTLSCS